MKERAGARFRAGMGEVEAAKAAEHSGGKAKRGCHGVFTRPLRGRHMARLELRLRGVARGGQGGGRCRCRPVVLRMSPCGSLRSRRVSRW